MGPLALEAEPNEKAPRTPGGARRQRRGRLRGFHRHLPLDVSLPGSRSILLYEATGSFFHRKFLLPPFDTSERTIADALQRLLPWLGVFTLISLPCTPSAHSQGKTDIVPTDAKLEKIFDGGVVLTEGVAVAPDGMVYFSDITFSHVSKDKKGATEAGHIWKFDPKTRKATIFRSPSGMSNGIKFDARGT